MSNPALNRLLRAGMTDFYVGGQTASTIAQRGNPHTMFTGEIYRGKFSAKTAYREDHNFQKKENRESGKSDSKKREKESDNDSDSDEDDGAHFKGKVPKKGSDGDGDGVKNERRKAGKKGKGPWDDENRNGVPNKIEKK